MESSSPLILLSAGGTGGHMTPARALAHDLLARGLRVALATDKRGLKYVPMFGEIQTHLIPSGTAAPGLAGKLKGLAGLVFGILQAFWLLLKTRPSLVVGFGGYPSVPAVYAAQKLGIPTLIHEQNAVIGKANRFLARRAAGVALSLPGEKGYGVVTGNPVRPEIAALFNQAYPAPKPGGELRILVMGGSLGAAVFSDVMPEAFAGLPADDRARLFLTQQCRADSLEAVRARYKAAGIKAELHEFIQDVAGELKKAHLVIARSGASTVAEITTAGRPAIFVPYPHHKDQQQKRNAETVAQAGGAWVILEAGFTPESLRARIESFLQTPSLLLKSAEGARSCGNPNAAEKLGDLVVDLIKAAKP